MSKMTTGLWFDHGKARKAANFYAATFPDSHVEKAQTSPSDEAAHRGEAADA